MLIESLVFACLIYGGLSSTTCENDEIQVTEAKICHSLSTSEDDSYCCYYTGKNLETGKNEVNCWEFKKFRIDNDKVFDTIKEIEKGTDDHVTKKHESVKLDCQGSYIKNILILLSLFLF